MQSAEEGRENSQLKTFFFRYVLSCAAATVAETVTYPLDLTKTRLQVAVDQQRKRRMLGTALHIAREEGVCGLWRGLAPAVYRHYVYTGCRMALYEHLRENVFKRDDDGTVALWKAVCCGVIAGAVSQFIASPTDLIKVQMQMDGVRFARRVRNTYETFGSIVHKRGVRALWRGWLPNCQRAALVNMADLATYDKTKHWILTHSHLEDAALSHGLSSACSGLAAAVVSTPSDVIKTRIMNQSYDQFGRGPNYKGSIDCLLKTVRSEGFFALYKGFVPIYIRMAPWSLTFWISYEKIRYMTGAPSF